MRAIIPVAGRGTRLGTITDSKPKVLVEVAGKPVLAHIIDNIKDSPIRELIFIVGYLKDQLIEWVRTEYDSHFDIHFITQEEQLGLGHAIFTAREFLDDSEVLIVLGDEIFSKTYSEMISPYRASNEITGAIGIKTVDDPTHYGMVKVGPDTCITHMVEKPKQFPEKTAIAGAYYLKHGHDIVESLEILMNNQNGEREYQLTDALQLLIKNGAKLPAFDVGDWYDCGRPEILLESNKRLLDKKHFVSPSCRIINSEIVGPCYLGPNSSIVNSKVGPYVSVGQNVKIGHSLIINTIIESSTTVKSVTLEGGIVSGSRVIKNRTSASEWEFFDINSFFSS